MRIQFNWNYFGLIFWGAWAVLFWVALITQPMNFITTALGLVALGSAATALALGCVERIWRDRGNT